MKQRSMLKQTGLVTIALLSLLVLTGNTFAQCSPRSNQSYVYQQPQQYSNSYYVYQQPQQYYSQGYYYGNNDGYYRAPSKTKNMVVGGIIGAVGGALLGGSKGAAIGAGAGVGTGYLIYRHQRNKEQDRYYRYNNPYPRY